MLVLSSSQQFRVYQQTGMTIALRDDLPEHAVLDDTRWTGNDCLHLATERALQTLRFSSSKTAWWIKVKVSLILLFMPLLSSGASWLRWSPMVILIANALELFRSYEVYPSFVSLPSYAAAVYYSSKRATLRATIQAIHPSYPFSNETICSDGHSSAEWTCE